MNEDSVRKMIDRYSERLEVRGGYFSELYPILKNPDYDVPEKYAFPRSAFGEKLVLSEETKLAWKKLLECEDWSSWIPQAEKFIFRVDIDLWSCPHKFSNKDCGCRNALNEMIREMEYSTRWEKPIVNPSPPQLLVGQQFSPHGELYGVYQGMVGSHRIKINIDYPLKRNRVLLHEIVHWIDALGVAQPLDSEVALKYGGHKEAFWVRFLAMAKELDFEVTLEAYEVPH